MVSRWNNRTGIAIAWLLLTAASAPAQVLDPYATVPSPTLASSASTARTASGDGSSAVGASVLSQPGGEAATGLQPTELPPANNSLVRSPSGYFDLDSSMPPTAEEGLGRSEWTWQLMPSSLIYKSYLAGAKEPRLASQHVNIKDDGWVWDVTLGSRVGLLRYGDRDPVRPNGFQIDMEGAA
ncbi:MAG TPA: hypothetical protein PLV92_19790, partial [Pirellulaceae bacterium]|nr:hypothetical protein [Pirellulaceae bacterium]